MRVSEMTFADLSRLALIAISVTACGQPAQTVDDDVSTETTGTDFDYATIREQRFAIRVSKGGRPLQGAAITITNPVGVVASEVERAAGSNGVAVFSGGTNADGSCAGTVAIPMDWQQVDVIVHHVGSRGPYSDESIRNRHGPFAPSARLTCTRAALQAIDIALEDR